MRLIPSAPNPSSRKFPLLQYLINALQKLATTRNIAVIILNQCVTKMRPGLGAALIPSISVTAWEQGLACRVALFRDWGWDDDEGKKVNGVRFAQVIKAEGVSLSEGRGRFAAFVIGEVSDKWFVTHLHIWNTDMRSKARTFLSCTPSATNIRFA